MAEPNEMIPVSETGDYTSSNLSETQDSTTLSEDDVVAMQRLVAEVKKEEARKERKSSKKSHKSHKSSKSSKSRESPNKEDLIVARPILVPAAKFEINADDRMQVRDDNRRKILSNRDHDLEKDNFKAVYNAVKSMIIGKQFNIREFTILVPLAMQTLATVNSIDGQQKKEMLVRVFKYLVEEYEFETVDQEELARHFVENDLEILIDTAYQASKGKYQFVDSTLDETYDMAKFDLVYGNIKRMVVNKKVDIHTIIILVPSVMVQVARFVNLTGLQKKDLVIQIIDKLLTEFHPENETVALITIFIQKQLPYIIDVIYRAAKSKYVFKKVASGWKKAFSCCYSQ